MFKTAAMVLAFSTLLAVRANGAAEGPPPPEGPYLGQTPPGSTPVVFAPGIVSKEHRDNSGFFSADMKEFYFTRKLTGEDTWWLVMFRQTGNQWREEVVMERVGRPLLSPDGKIMHLGKHYMERTEDGWSEVKKLGPDFDAIRIMRLASSVQGTYVLDEAGVPNGDGVLRYSRLVEGVREAPRAFGKEINTGKWNAHPFVAPDESYIIWDGERDSGQGDGDLYISFRQADGSWCDAINMGDSINTSLSESGAHVSPDGKYLFFNRNASAGSYDNIDIYWVDAQIIEELRAKQ